jgi:hypothetical protein
MSTHYIKAPLSNAMKRALIRSIRWILLFILSLVSWGFTRPAAAQPYFFQPQFVPNVQSFWDNSKNWTTNFGPAFRDTIELPSQLLPCSPEFALCFHSGPEPYPCVLSPDGRSASCTCTVGTSTNYTLITAILNYQVYLDTIQACGADGSECSATDSAPVCKYLDYGALIPGANLISTFDTESQGEILGALADTSKYKPCPKGPYAACMTAPCRLNRGGSTATCKCPVFYGKFQLTGADAQCSLGGNLVPSASYSPLLDANPDD